MRIGQVLQVADQRAVTARPPERLAIFQQKGRSVFAHSQGVGDESWTDAVQGMPLVEAAS